MLCEKVLGNLNDEQFSAISIEKIDYVDIEWHEAFKKLHKKISGTGKEVGIRLGNEVLTHGLNQGDVLFKDSDYVLAVNIPSCKAIIIDVNEQHLHMIAKICYEIGNKHATLFWGQHLNQFITPYNEPTLQQLQKLHGATVKVENVTFDFTKSISSTVNNHTH